jgi:Ca2+-binding RTX toxin-like protein
MPRIDGTAQADDLDGSVDPDQIYGGDGDDDIHGHGSGDEIFGEGGDDSLYGDAGDDTIEGGVGHDFISGGTGSDSLNGGIGNDTIQGGEGADLIRGDSGTDTLDYRGSDEGIEINLGDQTTNVVAPGITAAEGSGGHAEGDIVRGMDNVVGSDFDDIITGSDDANLISGGEGDDTLIASGGEDTLMGEGGDDTFTFDVLNGDDTVIGGETGDTTYTDAKSVGTGSNPRASEEPTVTTTTDPDTGNTVQTTTTYDPKTGNETTVTETSNPKTGTSSTRTETTPRSFDDSVTQKATAAEIAAGKDSGDKLDAQNNADDLTVNFASDEAGTMADDTYEVTFSEIEHVLTGRGADAIDASGSNADLILDAGEGSDTITSGGGDDLISLGMLDNGVDADGSDDILVLNDGFGDDSIEGFEAPSDLGSGAYSGNDQVDVSGLNDLGGNPVNVDDVTVTDTIGDGSGDAILQFPNGESITLWGVAPSEVASDAQLIAIGIPANAGSATIHDAIRLDGAPSGADTLTTADDELVQVDEPITFTAASASNIAAGDTTTIGGVAYQVVSVTTIEANITYNQGASSADIKAHGLQLVDTSGAAYLDYIIPVDPMGNLPDITEIEFYSVDPTTNIDVVDVDQNDTVTLFVGPNYIVEGTAASDTIDVDYLDDPENDRVDNLDHSDGSNDDSIEAYGGDDEITAGLGDDTVDGGIGSDTFVLDGNFGHDDITGGENTGDRDELDASTITDDLTVTLSSSEAGTLSDDAGTNTANFTQIEAISTGSGDDEIDASAGSTDMHLTGGFGADTFTGGTGNDTISLSDNTTGDDGSSDVVILTNGFGNDIIHSLTAPTSNGDGTFTGTDQFDVTGYLDGNGVPITTNDVVVSENADGEPTITFPHGDSVSFFKSSITLSDLQDTAFLNGLGIPSPAPDYIVEGTSGADTIDVNYVGDPEGDMIDNLDHSDGSNDDSVEAYAGNDFVDSGAGDDTIDGGAGKDTLYGGADEDLIYGGDNDDLLAGDGGADTVHGDAGNDVIFGDAGDDSLYGGTGNDTIYNGIGDDYAEGGADADTFYSNYNEGADTIVGGESGTDDDTLVSFKNTDSVLDLTAGGTAADNESGTLTTSVDSLTFSEIENIELSSGDDIVIGSQGDDNVSTGAGADTVDGGAGNDSFDLGSDSSGDVVVFSDGDDADAITNFDMADSGDGTTVDQLDVSGLTSDGGTTPVTTANVVVTDTVGDGSGDAILTFPGGESITLVGVTPAEVDTSAELISIGIPGPAPDYIVEGTSGADTIDANYVGDPEGDMIDNLDHSDNSNDDSIEGYAGDDFIEAGVGDDTAWAGADNDTVFGEDGNDLIYGEGGNDTLYGGDGDLANDGSVVSDGNDTIDGGDGHDSIYGEAGDDLLSGGDGNDHLYGSIGNDTLTGGLGGDSLIGEAGDDEFHGGDGIDRIRGGEGNDLAFGGADGDSIRGHEDNDTLHGEAGDDTILGDEGEDLIYAGSEDDLVWGGDDNDTVYGGTGADSLDGDDGDDIISGEEGTDTISGGDGADLIHGGADNDTIFGDTGGDTVDAGSDTIYGGTGNDSIDAGFSDDVVIAGDGADTVEGGAGNDMIFGDEPLAVEMNAGAAQGSGGGGAEATNLTDFPTDTFTIEMQYNGASMTTPGPTIDDPITTTLFSYSTAASPDELHVYAVSDNEVYDLSTPLDPNDTIIETGYVTVEVNGNSYTTGIESNTILDGTDHSIAVTFDAAAEELVVFLDGSPVETITLIDNTPIESNGTFSIGQSSGPQGGFTGEVFDTRLWDDIRSDSEISEYSSGTLEEEAGDPDLISNWVPDPFTGGFRDDVGSNDLTSTGGSAVTTQPGVGDDVLFGGDGSDTLLGSGGNDTLDGDGDDSTGGADYLDGGDGDDVLRGDVGNDTLYGRDGADTLEGGDGNDWLGGGDGADSLDGGTGNDTLFGNDLSDADTLQGGDDRDLIFATKNDSVDGGAGGDDWDILSVGGMSAGGSVNYVETGVDSNGNGVDGYIDFFDAGGSFEGRLNFEEIEEFTGIICFTKGANILTETGSRPIETLQVGDLVVTRDNGLQPIRWIGQRAVPGRGSLAPISFDVDALESATHPLLVSPQHRMLFTGHEAELLFGESEVLIPAKYLVNGTSVKEAPCAAVTYIHVMFDAHEVIYADGQATESFHAGDTGLDAIATAAREELFSVFPELRWNTGGHGDTARTCLKAHEAQVFATLKKNRLFS